MRPSPLLFSLVLVLAALPFLPALDTYFIADDFNFGAWLGPERRLDPGDLGRFFTETGTGGGNIWRPVPLLSWSLDYLLHGPDPVAVHLTGLFLNLLSVAAVFTLAARLLGAGAAPGAALLFALHPSHAEAVLWTAARNELLVTLFSVLALALHHRFLRGGGGALLAGSLVSFILALASKETAALLPAGLAAAHFLVRPRARRLATLLPFLAALAAYLALRRALFGPAFLTYGGVGVQEAAAGVLGLWQPLWHLAGGDPGHGGPWPALLGGLVVLAALAGLIRGRRAALRRASLPAVFLLLALLPLSWTAHVLPPRHLHLSTAYFALLVAAVLPWRIVPLLLAAAGLPMLLDGAAAQREAGRVSRATQAAALGARERFPAARYIVLAEVPRAAGRVSVFHTGLLGAVRRPFAPEDLPVVPLYADENWDLDGLTLALPGPAVFLMREPGAGWRLLDCIVGQPLAGIPGGIDLVAPPEGATVSLAADPPFLFRPARRRAFHRIVFEVEGEAFPFALSAAHLDETPEGLQWRFSRGSLVPRERISEASLRGLAGRTVRWRVEGTDDLRGWRATCERSLPSSFQASAPR